MLTNGTVLNSTYRIIEEIGSGGGGVVYKAYHERLKTHVVVKRIKERVKGILEKRTEADILKRIKHTYLPQVYDFLEIDGEIFTVMDYIAGNSLSEILAQGNPIPQKQVLKWAVQLSEALEYLHKQNPPIIHSDIKPANIMLTPAGDVCLIDFNISLAFDADMKTSLGTSEGYSPPEQYRNISHYRSQSPRGKKAALGESARKIEVTEPFNDAETEPLRTSPLIPAPSLKAPAPTEPLPTEPLSSAPAPTEPLPTVPLVAESLLAKQTPTEPSPTDPLPIVPSPTGPLKTESLPTEPLIPEPTDSKKPLQVKPLSGRGSPATATSSTEFLGGPTSPTELLIETIIGRGVDERSDIYSLGATLYHLLTGVKPGHDFDAIVSINQYKNDISEGLAHIINKMMALKSEERYPSGAELHYAFTHIYELDSGYINFRNKQKAKKIGVGILYAASAVLIALGVVTIDRERNYAYNRSVETAVTAIDTGDYISASLEIEYAMDLIPSRIEAYSREAQRLYAMGDYDGCAAYCKDVINNPAYKVKNTNDEHTQGDIFFTLGNAYLEKADYANAINSIKTAIECNNTNSQYYRDEAIAQARNGNTESAEEYLEEAIRLGLGQDSIYIVQGEIATVQMNYAAAETFFNSAISTATTDQLKQRAILMCANAYKNMGAAYLDREIELLETAENNLGTAISLNIGERLGDAYARKAETNQSTASVYYAKAIEKFDFLYNNGYPTFQTMENMAILYQQMNDFANAESMLNKMAEDYPSQYKVYKRLAFLEAGKQQRIANQSRNYAPMKRYYDQAVDLYQKDNNNAAGDTEMQMLDNLMRDLRVGGWL